MRIGSNELMLLFCGAPIAIAIVAVVWWRGRSPTKKQ
jgi:hypothetical protein